MYALMADAIYSGIIVLVDESSVDEDRVDGTQLLLFSEVRKHYFAATSQSDRVVAMVSRLVATILCIL